MVKSFSFKDLLIATAKQKSEAAKARAHSDPTLEKPRDIILAACARMGEQLKGDGFSFQKSGPRLKRIQNDLTFEINFSSDPNNIAGRRAAVWIYGTALSRKLANWRRDHTSERVRRKGRYAGTIVGAQIGNLASPPAWMEWDFADKASRQSQVDDAVAAIRQIILPFFAMFEDPARSVSILIHHPLLCQESLLEYAMSNINQEAAETAGRSFLRNNPEIQKRFERAFAEFTERGVPRYSSDVGSDLAALAIATNLDLNLAD